MRLRHLICLAIGLMLPVSTASADALQAALAAAYANNPELRAARAELRASMESLPQARAGFLPQVSATGSVGRDRTSFGADDEYTTPKGFDVQVVQPLFRGFRTVSGVRQARLVIEAQTGALHAVEQQVLLGAATAYLNLVRDEAVLRLNVNNEEVLSRQLEASQDRFRVGEITRTDVSQSESRLAGARAQRIQAEGVLSSSRATFERIVGMAPLEIAPQQPDFVLPNSLDAALAEALERNPEIISARASEAAAREGIDIVFGELLPELSLVGLVTRDYDTSGGFFDDRSSESITAQLSVPLYQAGSVSSRVREAKQRASVSLADLEQAVRVVREGTIQAWENLVSARASIVALDAQVEASRIALDGVRQEAQVGSRTTLDILDAEQELLNAQVDLVRARRDEVVAAYSLLAQLGRLTAGNLELDVPLYDAERYAERVNWKFWGTGIGED